MTQVEHTDCLVVGAGPAGSIAAALLAEWGRNVTLVDPAEHAGSIPEETMVPAARSTLERHGLLASVRAHDLRGTPRHGILWGDGVGRIRRNAEEERGYKIDRRLFDRDLRSIAGSRGVRLLEGRRVEGPLPPSGAGEVSLRAADGGATSLHARSILIAAGKQTGPSLVPLSLERSLPDTLALIAIVDRPRADRDLTYVEAVAEGWLWWLPLRDGRVSLSLFCDPWELRERGRDVVFDAAIGQAAGPARGLQIRPCAGVVATPRLLSTPAGAILTGDAASTIDPLSSQGIEKAIVSAEAAAVAVNTLLDGGVDPVALRNHHHAWETRLWLGHARQSLHYYLNETRFADRPFWERRHAAVSVEFESTAADGLPARIRIADGVSRRRAFRRKGRLLEPVEGFGLPDSPEVHERLGHVPVAPLLRILGNTGSTDEIIERAGHDADLCLLSRRMVLQALTELLRVGIIEDAGRPGDRR